MGRKLSKKELKQITQVAKVVRAKAGVKRTVTTKVYNMKWTDAIKVGAKCVMAQRKVKQTRLRFK